jgi:hypothetical protein
MHLTDVLQLGHFSPPAATTQHWKQHAEDARGGTCDYANMSEIACIRWFVQVFEVTMQLALHAPCRTTQRQKQAFCPRT